MSKSKELRIIQRAKDILEKGGWVQRYFGDPHGKGPHCASGAIQAAVYQEGGRGPQRALVERCRSIAVDILRQRKDDFDSRLSQWNDRPTRTKEEVIDLFTEVEQSLI